MADEPARQERVRLNNLSIQTMSSDLLSQPHRNVSLLSETKEP